MLSPAALSSLTSTFRTTRDRNTALGVWAAVSGLGGAAGVLFGGLLTEGPGWRWVLFINVPFSVLAFVGAFALLKPEATERGARTSTRSGPCWSPAGCCCWSIRS